MAPPSPQKTTRAGGPSKALAKSEEGVFQAVMSRPERSKYVRKMSKPKGCVFCAVEAGRPSTKTLLLYKNEKAMVLLNKYPYNSGHLLVLPRAHVGGVESLSDEEFLGWMEAFRRSLAILQRVYKPEGVNTGLNLGKAAGAGIPGHLHMHIVPRWSGDTNFFPLLAKTKVVIETVNQSYSRLRPHFQKLK